MNQSQVCSGAGKKRLFGGEKPIGILPGQYYDAETGLNYNYFRDYNPAIGRYSIRNIQSSKKITVAATGKDPVTGKTKTEEYTVNGPVTVMITTTSAELEGETSSRFLSLTIDESSKVTDSIHEKLR